MPCCTQFCLTCFWSAAKPSSVAFFRSPWTPSRLTRGSCLWGLWCAPLEWGTPPLRRFKLEFLILSEGPHDFLAKICMLGYLYSAWWVWLQLGSTDMSCYTTFWPCCEIMACNRRYFCGVNSSAKGKVQEVRNFRWASR